MKNIIICAILIIAITALAFTSSALASNYLDTLSASADEYRRADAKTTAAMYRSLYEDYKKREVWLCIIIDDESLIKIEEDFADVIAQASTNSEEAEISINRLICHLEQIRRLSGFNIKSIL